VVGIVVNQYPEISTLRKEILKVLTDLDNLVNGSFKKKEADRLSRLAQQKRDIQRTLARYMQNEQAAKRKKGQLE